jgi:hypothetical protein
MLTIGCTPTVSAKVDHLSVSYRINKQCTGIIDRNKATGNKFLFHPDVLPDLFLNRFLMAQGNLLFLKNALFPLLRPVPSLEDSA